MTSDWKCTHNFYKRSKFSDKNGLFTYSDVHHLVRIQERHRETLRILKAKGRNSLSHLCVLDVGCGNGNLLRQMLEWGSKPANLAGIDINSARVQRAIMLNHRFSQ